MRNTKPKTTPNCLKKCRKARGLKQKDVARIMGIKSASMLSRWEQGTCLPSTRNALKLAVIYRTMVDSFFMDQMRELKRDIYKREEKIINYAKRTGN